MKAAMLFVLMAAALVATGVPSGVEAESPTGKSYIAFIPRDNWNSYAGWYVAGQSDDTQYQIQVYNPATNEWDVCIDWTSIDQGDLHTHMDDLPGYWRTYRLVSTKPVQATVTSGEGSNMVPAYTSARYTGKDFTFLGNFRSSLNTLYPEFDLTGPYGAVVFGLEDNTRGTVELWRDNGDKKFDLGASPQPDTLIESRTFILNTDQHFTFGTWEQGTTFWRVTSDKDVLVTRVAGDGDEDDPVISVDGRPFGKKFFFASPKDNPGSEWASFFGLGFRLRNREDSPATVRIYDVLDPANPLLMGTYIVPAKSMFSVPRSYTYRHDGYKIRYVKLESDKIITVIGGQNMLRGDTIFFEPSITGDMKSYMTNMIYGFEGFYDNSFEDAAYNEFVAVDENDSVISVDPSIDVSNRTLQYYSSSAINKVYYKENGTPKTSVLDKGRGSISFDPNTFLTGFYVESDTNLVWGGIGNRGDSFNNPNWIISSENRFVFRQGGNGNCWILGIRAPDPWVEADVKIDKGAEGECGIFHFTVTLTNFGPQSALNVKITDTLIDELKYVEGSTTLNGDPFVPDVDGQTLTFLIGDLSTDESPPPTTATLKFDAWVIKSIPEGRENTAEAEYWYWDPYWEWTNKIISDTEPLPPNMLGEIILYKFLDLDRDGIQDIGEGPITDPIEFCIYRKDGSGTRIDERCATIDSDGKVVFEELPPGDYYVEISDDLNYVITGGMPDNPIPVYCDSHTYHIGQYLVETGTIGVEKFLDINENGIWDEGEPPLQGIEFHLYGMTDSGELIDITLPTDENGHVVFEVPPGEYYVEISNDKGYKVTTGNIPIGPINVEPGSSDEFVVGDWIEFPLNCCSFEGLGYWKHQIDVYWINHQGNAQETKEDMETWLDEINDLFLSEIFGDDDIGDDNESLYVDSTQQGAENAFNILQLGGGGNTPEQRLRAHLLTLEFNYVSGKADNCDEYDKDAVEQLIWIAEWALKNQREDLYEFLKDKIEFMNENPLGTIVVKNFLDANQNGTKDEGEPLILPGWNEVMEIQLCRMDKDGNLIDCRSPEIDENGFATFSGLTPDAYYVNVIEDSDELEVTTELPIGPILVECDSHESWVGIWWISPPTPSACDQRGLGYWKEQIDWYWGKGKNETKSRIPKEDLLAWMDKINDLFFSLVFGDDDEVEQCEKNKGNEECEIHSYPVSSLTPENALWIFELGPGNHSPAEKLRQHLLAAEFNHVSGRFYCTEDEEQKYLIELFLWTAEWILINVDPDTEEGKQLYEQWKNWIEELNESGNPTVSII